MKLGALFSGSGGFELAGQLVGFTPVWASEIEPFPILVTTKRFPKMLHLGNIKKLDGAKIPKVEVITGGSPCQDMSIAGKREGLDGSRSNLFREQIRIVKEMRESDKADGRTGKEIRPRYMVWENVPGAFSSNKGEDFRCVLEEICQVADAEVSIPRPPKGKWGGQGTIVGNGYSVSWRTLDAQYWGVPQRRKRIYLVADFGGESAPQILFKQDSMRGNFKESIKEREGTPGSSKNSTNKSDRASVECFDISDRRSVVHQSINSPTHTQKMGTGRNNVPIIIENHSQDCRWSVREDGTFQTLTGQMGTGGNNVPILIIGGHYYDDGKSGTLRAKPGDNQQIIMYENVKYIIIRRLTPTECGRLQGFPDGWADNLETENITADDIDYWKLIFQQHTESLGIVKKDKTDNQIKKWLSNPESDTAKYKMWGNGIALPCAVFVMQGIAHELQRRSMKEITINVPDGTQLLHVLAVVDMGKEIHYETKFCDLRDGNTEYSLNLNDEKNIGEAKESV